MRRLLASALLLLLFTSCHTSVSLQKTESVFYTPGNTSQNSVDSSVLVVTQPYKDKLDLTMNEVLAQSDVVMEKGQPESRLGNFVADLCFAISTELYKPGDGHQIDFCVLNNGGLRSSLPSGNITRRNAYELMPFDNELVVVTLIPDSLFSLLKYINDKGGVPVSNIKMKLGTNSPNDVVIGNSDFDRNKIYKVLTSDYLSNGGDAMIMFSNSVKTESLGLKVRDAIIKSLESSGKNKIIVTAKTDGRISK